ncbi:alpha/beta hydrolase family protein [Hyphobacterium sp.]|uniref:alpha/beta hydrolase family protein n=1 Tax=Hyphobacterium sp. TaxID=2004662 RepID=UPI003BACFA46
MNRVLSLAAAASLTAASGAFAQGEVVPLEYFATFSAIDQVALSPDGENIAMRRLTARDGDYIIEVRSTDDLTGDPIRLGAERMQIESVQWVSPEYLRIRFRQQVRDSIEGVNQGVYEFKQAIVHYTGEGGFRELDDDVQVVRFNRADPDNIIIRTSGRNYNDNTEGRAFSEMFTPDFYRYNVRTGRQTRILRASQRFGNYVLDQEGNPRFAEELNRGDQTVTYFWRPDPDESDWQEVLTWSLTEYDVYGEEGVSVVGFDPDDQSRAYAIAYNGHDTRGAYILDLDTGEFVREIYRHDQVDLLGAIFEPDRDREPELAGFIFYADGEFQRAFINRRAAEIQGMVDAAFPDTNNQVSCVNDCAQMTVFAQSEQEPGVYYYIENGQPTVIGRQYPQLLDAAFGEEQYFEYTARDGLVIPSLLTLPPFGEAPYPLVVVPHGGPWSADLRSYDEWVTVLTNRGYAVMQPQFRGTTGYGLRHWLLSWGQWGITMQDDKDDGARYLVEQGIADPNRIAMFGWSYGGYAAFAAAVRQPPAYNCAIAGAGVSNIDIIQRDFGGSPIRRELIEDGYQGMSPNEFAEDIRMPLLIIHPENDQRVPIYQSEFMVRALERNRVPHRFVRLPDADHFGITLNFDNQLTLFTELTSFLANECGMPTDQNPPRQGSGPN